MALISLTAAVDVLGFPRSRLLAFIKQGMPVQHDKNNRVRLDVDAARSWIEIFGDAVDQPKAKRLDPSDPRFRERSAAAALAFQKAAVQAGVSVPRVAALARYENEIIEFRTRLFSIPQRLAPNGPRAANMADLQIGIDEALAPLRADDIKTWNVNVAAVDALMAATPAAEDADADSDRPTLPIMDSTDPRSLFMVAQSSRREIALADFLAGHYPLATVLHLAGATYAAIRERVGQIPTRLELADEGDFNMLAAREIDEAMMALSQHEGEFWQ